MAEIELKEPDFTCPGDFRDLIVRLGQMDEMTVHCIREMLDDDNLRSAVAGLVERGKPDAAGMLLGDENFKRLAEQGGEYYSDIGIIVEGTRFFHPGAKIGKLIRAAVQMLEKTRRYENASFARTLSDPDDTPDLPIPAIRSNLVEKFAEPTKCQCVGSEADAASGRDVRVVPGARITGSYRDKDTCEEGEVVEVSDYGVWWRCFSDKVLRGAVWTDVQVNIEYMATGDDGEVILKSNRLQDASA
jgi:hypothetical protein